MADDDIKSNKDKKIQDLIDQSKSYYEEIGRKTRESHTQTQAHQTLSLEIRQREEQIRQYEQRSKAPNYAPSISEAAEYTSNTEHLNKLKQKMHIRESSIEQESIKAISRAQRERGEDPESIERYVKNITKGTGIQQQSISDIKDPVSERKQASKDISEAAKAIEQLTAKIRELKQQGQDTTAATAEQIQKQQELTAHVQKHKEATKEQERQEKERAEKGEKIARYGQIASRGGDIINAASYGYRQIAIEQDVQQLQNQAGLSNIANQEYDLYRAATHGSVAAQLSLLQRDKAHKFADEQKEQTQTAEKGEMTGNTLGAIGDVLQQVGIGIIKGNKLEAITNTAGAVISNGVNIAVSQRAYSKDIYSDQEYMRSYSATAEAYDAAMRIPAQQMQEVRDLGVGLVGASGSMNISSGSAFMKAGLEAAKGDIVDPTTGQISSRLSRIRMGQQEFAAASQFGAKNLGNAFNVDQIEAAQKYMLGGVGGSAMENLQRFATLQGGGANNPQAAFGSVLEAAMTKSLEGAKTLNMMVQYTSDMAKGSTAQLAGVDTQAESAKTLAGLTRTGEGVNENLALSRAKTLSDTINEQTTGTGVNYRDLIGIARIRSGTNLSQAEAMMLKQFNKDDLASMTPEKFEQALIKRGIDPNKVMEGGAPALLKKLRSDQMTNFFEAALAGSGIDVNKHIESIKKGDFSNPELRKAMQIPIVTGMVKDFDELEMTAKVFQNLPLTAAEKAAKKKADEARAGKSASSLQADALEMKTMGGEQEAKMMIETLKAFKDAESGFKVLADLARQAAKIKADPEKEFREASAAANTEAFKTFKTSTDKFDQAVDKFINRLGVNVSTGSRDTTNKKRVGLQGDKQ